MAFEKKSDRNLKTNSVNEKSLVVMANTLARKATRWTAPETKLFLAAVSQIQSIDDESWVTMSKADTIQAIGIGKNELRSTAEQVAKKSWVQFGTEEVFDDGFLITRIKSSRNTISIQFAKDYLPLVEHLQKEFIKFQLRNVNGMKSKYSIALYMDLKSHYDKRHTVMHWTYSMDEIKALFNISKTDYVRKNGHFHTGDFYKKTLAVAEKEINQPGTGMRIMIETLHKGGKSNGYVLGYDISFMLTENGEIVIGSEED